MIMVQLRSHPVGGWQVLVEFRRALEASVSSSRCFGVTCRETGFVASCERQGFEGALFSDLVERLFGGETRVLAEDPWMTTFFFWDS